MNQRTEFALQALRTDNFSQLCREYGISTKTGYKWRDRLISDGANHMRELSRRPHSSSQKLDEAVVCEIVRLKEAHRHWGPRKLRSLYARRFSEVPSESSFKRVLTKAGLVERRRVRQRTEAGRLFTDRRAEASNDVWTVDFKGWWYTRDGERCEPLTVRDEYSRYVLEVRALADARTQTVRVCFERLFERHGLPSAIRSDNGAPFASRRGVLGLSRLSAWWVALGIDLERGRPGCPQDNGAHERLHRDMACELEGRTLIDRQAALDEWRQTFNQERPHEALGMRCPGEVYVNSSRKFHGTPEELDYDGMQTRRVQQDGCIVCGARVPISSALSGW